MFTLIKPTDRPLRGVYGDIASYINSKLKQFKTCELTTDGESIVYINAIIPTFKEDHIHYKGYNLARIVFDGDIIQFFMNDDMELYEDIAMVLIATAMLSNPKFDIDKFIGPIVRKVGKRLKILHLISDASKNMAADFLPQEVEPSVHPKIKSLVEGVIGPSKLAIGKVVKHPDGRMVKIIDGQYWGSRGISNHWSWREVKKNKRLGKVEHGYGW